MDAKSSYVPYSDSVEAIEPDEQKTFEELNQLFERLGALMLDRYRHAARTVHAKSHGMLLGDLSVPDDLPPALKQGLFATSGTYAAVLRFSTNPGDILADSISTPRGLAMKVLGVDGPRASANDESISQDFVMAVGPAFAAKDAKAFLGMQKFIELNANDPEPFKKIVSAGARVTNAVLGVVGLESPAVAALGYPSTHPLGETYFSQVPLRYGDYIAKICVRPKSENLKKLVGNSITSAFHYSAVRDAIVEFFKTESAEWEVCAQLCTDLKAMPVEDATVIWDEKASQYQPVATLRVQAQDAYSNARRALVDDRMIFTPWNALAAHRPLGNIMRSRKSAYEVSANFRMTGNAVCPFHPKVATDIPA